MTKIILALSVLKVIQINAALTEYCISHEADPYNDYGIDLGNFKLDENELRFLSIGDWGTVGAVGPKYDGNYTIELAELMGQYAHEWNPHFVVSLGDHFYETDVDSVEHSRWNESFEDVFTAESLQNIYWYGALGNHAYDAGYLKIGNGEDNSTWDSGQNSQFLYTTAPQNRYKRWCLPSYYYQYSYSFDSVKVRFVAIDSLLIQHCYGETPRTICFGKSVPNLNDFYLWIHKVFEEASNNNELIVILSHYTFVSDGILGLKNEKIPTCGGGVPSNNFFQNFTDIMLQYKVALYIAGHEHNSNILYALNKNDTDSNHKLIALTTGAFGQIDGKMCGGQSDISKQYENSTADWRLLYGGAIHGFGAVTVNKTGMKIQMIGTNGVFADYFVDINEILPGNTKTNEQYKIDLMMIFIIFICVIVVTVFIMWQYYRSYISKNHNKYGNISEDGIEQHGPTATVT